VYHLTLGLRVIKKKKKKRQSLPAGYVSVTDHVGSSKNLKDLKDLLLSTDG